MYSKNYYWGATLSNAEVGINNVEVNTSVFQSQISLLSMGVTDRQIYNNTRREVLYSQMSGRGVTWSGE